MLELRYNTAGQEIPLGVAVDSTDGDTAETGLTIANTDILIWKWGATTLASKNSGGATHISNGIYYAVLDATDTNTLGPMKIFIHVAGALYLALECAVVNQNYWDAKYASDYLQVDAVQVEGSDATDQIRDAVVDDATRIDASALNTLSGHDPGETIMGATDLGDGSALTEAGGTGDHLTALPLNDLSEADIRTAIGLAAANLDTQIAALPTDADVNAQCDTAISDAALATAANLQIVDDNVDAILVDTNELQTNQGNWLTATGFSTHSAADVWAVTTRTLSSFGTLVSDIATAVWAAVTRTLTAGTKDTEIEAIKAVTDVIPDSGQMTSIAQDATVAKSTELFDPDADKVNIGKVNDITIDGSGTEEDPWGPA